MSIRESGLLGQSGRISAAAALLCLAACGSEAGSSGYADDASAEAVGATTQAVTVVYEAETAARSGAIVGAAHAGYTGSGYVDYQNASNDYVEWTVSTASAGQYTLGFRYANGGATSRPLQLKVNGAVANASLAFPASGGWDKWTLVTTTVTLGAGTNKVRATAIGSSGGDIDHLEVSPFSDPIVSVKKSPGCGLAAPQAAGSFVRYTLATSGTKASDCADHLANGTKVCGPWSLTREYYLALPNDYDPNHAYPLVLQLTGCGGKGNQVYGFDNIKNGIIRVGLTPPPNTVGHATNPGEGCYDDKEGDDSVDFAFYEKLRDTLKNQVCFDDNRVTASGVSTGSLLANNLACRYSGNTQGYGLRSVASTAGGQVPSQFMPTCTSKPTSGMWIHEPNDTVIPFSWTKAAINRALSVNGCSAASYDVAQFADYAVPGFAPNTCKQILGCSNLYPLVVCPVVGSTHSGQDALATPGYGKFIAGFTQPPLAN